MNVVRKVRSMMSGAGLFVAVLIFGLLAGMGLSSNGSYSVNSAVLGNPGGLEASVRGTASVMVATALAQPRVHAQAMVTSTPEPPSINITWLPDTISPWKELLIEAGERHGVDPELLAIVQLVESGGSPAALSPSGAVGLMQVMPPTAKYIAGKRGIKSYTLSDPATNIDFGAWYLAEQLGSFGIAVDQDWVRSVDRAAVAYNAGPGHLKAHLGGRTLYNEAARYQGWVGGMWRERRLPESPTYERWYKAGGQRLVTQAAKVALQ